MNSNNEVKILIGSHGSGKSKWLYDTLIDKSRMENDKSKIDLTKRIYLVVPEQDTNDKQRILMKEIEEKGYKSGLFNIDVVSFDRLAYTVFERLKIETKKIIDDFGKAMILSIVISELNPLTCSYNNSKAFSSSQSSESTNKTYSPLTCSIPVLRAPLNP